LKLPPARCRARARREIFDYRDINPAQAKLARWQAQSKRVLERVSAWIDE
jgi:hypothetical protein